MDITFDISVGNVNIFAVQIIICNIPLFLNAMCKNIKVMTLFQNFALSERSDLTVEVMLLRDDAPLLLCSLFNTK